MWVQYVAIANRLRKTSQATLIYTIRITHCRYLYQNCCTYTFHTSSMCSQRVHLPLWELSVARYCCYQTQMFSLKKQITYSVTLPPCNCYNNELLLIVWNNLCFALPPLCRLVIQLSQLKVSIIIKQPVKTGKSRIKDLHVWTLNGCYMAEDIWNWAMPRCIACWRDSGWTFIHL